MDPLTQGALGAVAAQLTSKPSRLFHACVIGGLGAMAPDLDVLIRSETDPLLALQYHRQFTHSLLTIPFFGAIVGLLAYVLFGKRWQLTLWQAILWSTIGYATHGLLDGCTSYGTQLLWPITNERFAWDLISVIDPLFTLPVLVAIALSLRSRSRYWIGAAVSWMVMYLAIGFIQHERAITLGHALAAERGHTVLRLEAKPSFGNVVVWKVVYETAERFYVDAVRPGWSSSSIWQGDSVPRLDINSAFPWLQAGDQQYRDIGRFAEFSAGYIAVDPSDPARLFDLRYSMLPDHIDPMWGITLSANKRSTEHADFFTDRANGAAALNELIAMIFDPQSLPNQRITMKDIAE